MKCKDVAEIVDLGSSQLSWAGKFRLRLHLSLCQACENYYETTLVLKKAMNDFINQNQKTVQIEKLNDSLLAKYAIDHKAPKK